MKSIDLLFNRASSEMSPYAPIEPPDQIARRLNLPEDRIVKLDANENPFGTAPPVLAALGEGKYYHIYPDPAQVRLREAIAGYCRCRPAHIVAGTGADELIDLACRMLLEPGDKVMTFTPSFAYYSHVVALNRGIFETYPRKSDFTIDSEQVRDIDLDRVKLVILCSPNNPTGNLLEDAVLEYFLSRDLVVMVDEAYHEFAGVTCLDRLHDHENLMVLRTFSKCFALAGLRVGYAVGSEKLVQRMMRIKPPFSVNVAAEVAVEACLRNLDLYRRQVEEIIRVRHWVEQELIRFEQLQVFPSRSNFILCRVIDAEARFIYERLQTEGILVRYFSTDLLRNYIRISIGTAEQMGRFLSELKRWLR